MWRGEHQALILMVPKFPVTASNLLQQAFVLLKNFFLFVFVRGSGLSA